MTLVEMLVVLGVIALLVGVAIAITRRVENQSKERAVANVFALLRGALQEFYEETDAFPEQSERDSSQATVHIEWLYEQLDSIPASRRVLAQVNRALIVSSDTTGDATQEAPLRICDPWGTVLDYFYAPDDQFPELISAGPDEEFGTADDISSRSM